MVVGPLLVLGEVNHNINDMNDHAKFMIQAWLVANIDHNEPLLLLAI